MIKSGPTPGVDAAVVETLCCHRWPLNIREVTNLAKRVLALHDQDKILKRSQLVALMGDAAPARKADPSPAEAAATSEATASLTPAEREDRRPTAAGPASVNPRCP